MRAQHARWAWAAVLGLGLAPAAANAQDASYILKRFEPVIKGVDYDTPATADEVKNCKVEEVKGRNGEVIGFAVRDAQGKLLRKFVDTNGKIAKRDGEQGPTTHLDRWSYYRDGFEIYRESDTDEDGALDEVRWLNAGGSRIGQVKAFLAKGQEQAVYRVVSWSRLSPEEASKMLVQAVIDYDLHLLDSLMATPDELKAAGLPDSVVKAATEGADQRKEKLDALRKALKGWDNQTNWSRFDGMMPHVIPSDVMTGMNSDIVLYENAAVFATPGSKSADPRSVTYLHVPEVVKLGDTWKFLDLPNAVDPSQPVAQLSEGRLRQALYGQVENGGPMPTESTVPAELLADLAKHDAAMPGPEAGDKVMAQWHLDRIEILKKILAVASPDEKLNFYKLVVHDLAEAYRTGLYPQGATLFDSLIKQGGKLGSFATYRRILAEFDLEADKPGANLQAVQEAMVDKLKGFLKDFPGSDEEPEVLFQLATVYEFNGGENEAKTYWSQLAQKFPQSAPGKKAQGALKRLDLDGKTLNVSGPTLDGKTISTADFQGKTLLVVYWMSLTEPDRRELIDLLALYDKHKAKGFEVLSVNLDPDRSMLDTYLKQQSLPWPVIFEDGSLDSRPANDLGIIATPTMILVSPEGKVLSHQIRKASEVEKYLEKPLASKPVGLNLKQ